jgi:hypothetical protein
MEEKQESTFERSLTRRGFVSWVGRVGFAVVGGIAGVIALETPAEAACGQMACGASSANWRCCSLNKPNVWCPTDQYGQSICNPPYYLYVWTCCCCGGDRTYACAECITIQAGTCCVGPSYTHCSGGWTTSTRGCYATSMPPPGNCP